jgi:hypothetical protein
MLIKFCIYERKIEALRLHVKPWDNIPGSSRIQVMHCSNFNNISLEEATLIILI